MRLKQLTLNFWEQQIIACSKQLLALHIHSCAQSPVKALAWLDIVERRVLAAFDSLQTLEAQRYRNRRLVD